MALRTALPAGSRSTGTPIAQKPATSRPSLALALSGAGALLALLIGGQLLYPAKTYSLQQGALDQPIEMAGTAEPGPADQAQASRAQPHVTMRVPPDSGVDGDEQPAAAETGDADELFAPVDPGQSTPAASTGESAPSDDLFGADRPAESIPTTSTSEKAASDALFASDSAAEAFTAASTSATDADDSASAAAAETETSAPQRERLVKFLNGTLTLDVYKHATIGSPAAQHVMIEMVSYNCSHCRKMHRTMERGLARYGNQMAIVVMPVPLEMSCNKLVTDPKASNRGACATARFTLGLAALSPRSFPKFHAWLMTGEKPPALEKIIPKAYGIVGREQLHPLTRSEQIRKQIADYVNLFAKLRNRPGSGKDFGLPVQILGDHVLAGTVEKEADVFAAWEEHLGVKAP